MCFALLGTYKASAYDEKVGGGYVIDIAVQ